jgi:hypothetical protein
MVLYLQCSKITMVRNRYRRCSVQTGAVWTGVGVVCEILPTVWPMLIPNYESNNHSSPHSWPLPRTTFLFSDSSVRPTRCQVSVRLSAPHGILYQHIQFVGHRSQSILADPANVFFLNYLIFWEFSKPQKIQKVTNWLSWYSRQKNLVFEQSTWHVANESRIKGVCCGVRTRQKEKLVR